MQVHPSPRRNFIFRQGEGRAWERGYKIITVIIREQCLSSCTTGEVAANLQWTLETLTALSQCMCMFTGYEMVT